MEKCSHKADVMICPVTKRQALLKLIKKGKLHFLVWLISLLCAVAFQRHFTVLAFNFPSTDALTTIYGQIFHFHLQQQAFCPSVLRAGPSLIQAAIAFHQMVAESFVPTAIKFHYIFNLRDLSNIFQVPQLAS